MTVTLTGFISVPEDRIDDIRKGLENHIQLTRAEPGCLRFVVTEDPDIPGRFNVSEEFTDAASFEAHQSRAAASDWAQISKGIPRDYRVQGLDGVKE